MASGPSKEQLEMYWKQSRQYFDELANYYRTADPQYYNEHIAPFYSNPLYVVSSGKKGSAGARAVLLSVIVLIAVGIAGIAVFFISTSEQEKTDTKKTGKNIEKSTDKDIKTYENEEKDGFPDDDFIQGSKYIAEKDYDKAEEHLKKIKPGDKNYREAQQLLKSIKYLRKYNK